MEDFTKDHQGTFLRTPQGHGTWGKVLSPNRRRKIVLLKEITILSYLDLAIIDVSSPAAEALFILVANPSPIRGS